MQNKEEASKKLSIWMYAFVVLVALLVFRFVVHTYISLSNTPAPTEVLLNQQGGVFSGEDLSKTDLSEGQVKQLFYEVVVKALSYDYLSFSTDEQYASYLTEGGTDLPDHRDVLMPWFTDEAYEAVMDSVQSMPWMSDFYNERIQLIVRTSRPPVRKNIDTIWSVNSEGELEASYTGFLYVESRSRVVRSRSFRVNYTGVIKRVPLTGFNHKNDYYFPPMVELNTSGWKISELSLDSERRN